MGERTYAQIYVHECPGGEREALREALTFTFWSAKEDWGSLPIRLAVEEVPCGTIEEEAENWAAAAPGATWLAWEDPKYEYPGAVAYCVRGEIATFPCDAFGRPIVTFQTVKGAGVGDEVLERLFPGHKVIERFRALTAKKVV